MTQAFCRAHASQGQMTPDQYFRVAAELLSRGPCSLLVIGAGKDTELYVQANTGGHTVVLEDNPSWIAEIDHLTCQKVRVTYQTRIKDGLLEPCPLPRGISESFIRQRWDVILVDAPEGYQEEQPGRQQSIYLASILAGPGSTIFLHDWQRPHEQQCAARYLQAPDELYGERQVLAVFRY